MGFVLAPSEAAQLIDEDPTTSDVLQPYLTADDLLTSARYEASRWVINFRDLPAEHARRYAAPWGIVEDKVRPERQRKKPDGSYALRRPLPERYWMYADKRPGLYRSIASLQSVIVIPAVSKIVTPVMVPTGQVFAHRLIVVASDDEALFGLLASSVHWHWAVQQSSTIGQGLNYSPTDALETFPLPVDASGLRSLAAELARVRERAMLDLGVGLTKIYNQVNDPSVGSPIITELRETHAAIDQAVLAAYGWEQLALDHGFHETRLGLRFTIAPKARGEVLARLLELNHARYAREQADQATGAKPVRRRGRSAPGQVSMLGED
jgi:hypothetical protein